MNNKSGSEMGELVDKDILKRISEYWGGKFCGDAVGIKTLWNNASSDIDLLLSHAAYLQKLCEEQKRDYEEVCSVARGLRDRLDAVRDLVLDDVPHRYQKRLLEVLR